MKRLYILVIIGLVLVLVGCGTQYHTLTLTNEATEPTMATIYADNEQKMTAFSGETEQQIFKADIYTFQICINYFVPETISQLLLDTIDLNHDMTCTISETGETVTWE
jgi:hypothetical protein